MAPMPAAPIVALLIILGLGASGCRRSSPEGGPPTEAAPRPTFCETVTRENAQALKALPPNADGAALRDALRATVACQGAWGVVVGDLAVDADEIGGRWTLVHAANGKARQGFTPDTTTTFGGAGPEQPAPRQNLTWSAAKRSVPVTPTLFDFDGDGQPEAVVIVETTETMESGRSFTVRRGRIWSAGTDGIQPYAPARNFAIEDVRDVDGDGRPDLITHEPYAAFATVTCGSEDPYPVSGPALLVHSLPDGSFSWSDLVAAEFARKDCPSLPKPVVVVSRAVKFAASARHVACARLWGARPIDLIAEIAKRCAKTTLPCPDCDDRALLERWARFPAPVSLSPPRR